MMCVYLTIALVFLSCKRESGTFVVNLEDEVLKVIVEYVNNHPQLNTFILQYSPSINTTVKGYLLGPGYENILRQRKCSIYFEIQSKRIYCISEMDALFRINEEYLNAWVNLNVEDSLNLREIDESFPDWTIKDEQTLFIYRSIFFRYNEYNKIEVSNRPDTLFLPKYKGSIDFGY